MFEWDSTLETGHSSIDEEHRQFVRILRALEVAIEQDQGASHLHDVISALHHYVLGHFAREEAYMLRIRCPAFELNCRAHNAFTERFADWMQTVKSGHVTPSLAAQIHHECSEWIRTHILTVDCKMRGCAHATGP